MKELITHRQPHIDDICGMWLIERYVPGWDGASHAFIATNMPAGSTMDAAERLHIGVGRGRFDEHKGDVGECCTTLVYAWVKEQADLDERERAALDRLVDWVLREDLGQLHTQPDRIFALPSALFGLFAATKGDSEAMTGFGYAYLDGVIVTLRNEVQLAADWQTRKEMDTRFGAAVGFTTDADNGATFAYRQGARCVVVTGRERPYATIRAVADSDIDLSDVAAALAERDPGARWFFHHSKKMLICGGEKVEGKCESALSLEELMELLR